MKPSITDKRKIAARLFFSDNRDSYDDFQDALNEFTDGKNQTDAFIDTLVSPILKPVEEHILLMRYDGHVATLRLADNFFSPRTKMIEEEGEELKEQFEITNQQNPNDNELELLLKMGWTLI